jgi:hypothetical protein
MKAWQRQIRERIAASDGDLLGRWWDGIDVDIAKAEVRPIDRGMAEGIILTYEWLGCMPAVTWYTYGIFFDGVCGGVVVFGPEYAENLGVWDSYGYTGKIICLSRGACTHWAHPHSATKLIMQSARMLPKRFEVVTATSDYKAGEIGTIYQACGWHAARMNTHTRSGAIVNGKRVSSRALRGARGKSDRATIANIGGVVEVEEPKLRYFYFRGPVAVRRKHRGAIASRIVPYPKRAAEVSSRETPEFQPEGAGQFGAAAPTFVDAL